MPPAARLLLTLLLGVLSSCSRRGPVGPGPVAMMPAQPAALETGDVLTIEVFGEKDLSGKFQISEEGTIDFPLVGRVRVVGKTPPQVASLLGKKLGAGYLKQPHVAVLAEGFNQKKKIHVWGQVQKSSTFNYTHNMTLIEALTLAGGLTPLADKDGIRLSRLSEGRPKQYSVPMGRGQSATYQLRPGDVIFVPERVF